MLQEEQAKADGETRVGKTDKGALAYREVVLRNSGLSLRLWNRQLGFIHYPLAGA